MRAALLCAIAALLTACGDSGPVDDIVTAPLFMPPKSTLQDQQIVLPRGRALAFVAQPMGQGETLKLDIVLGSQDPKIADVTKTVEMNQFVVFGVNVGKTKLTVREEGGQQSSPTLDVEVVEP
jgi:hypothetical protein